MDQVKEILRQLIKHRFWIAVCIAALLPVIAYVVGSGPVQAKAEAQTKAIQDAKKDVEQYANGTVPNRQWPPIVSEKTEELTKDVNGSWKKLYERQAPLLTWPAQVQERFRKWGRKWPEDVDASRVQVAIIEYVTEYPNYVDEVYKIFQPFDVESGEGIVSAPPKETLLRPAPFKAETPPDLGKVWAAQERLWIQRTVLGAVAEVNKNAKSWDNAVVRQINILEVGNPAAQDQRSLAKGEELEEAPAITDPKAPPEEAEPTGSDPMAGSAMAGMMMGGGATAKPDTVYYIKPQIENAPYKILPLELQVLVDQDRIQDFLCGLENSPMNIQVMELELAKPSTKVVKPKQGENMMFGGMMGAGGMSSAYAAMMMRTRSGATGFGGGMPAAYEVMMRRMAQGSMSGGPMGGPAVADRTGVSKRGVDRRKQREEKEKEAAETPVKESIHDPYYNIIEVTVYGQARFYNPPPPEEPAAESSHAASSPDAAKAEGETPKAEAEPAKDEAGTPKTEPAKDVEGKEKAEEPKAEADDKGGPAKADAAKGEAPKAESEPETPNK